MAGKMAVNNRMPARTGHGIILGVVLIAVGLAIKMGMEFADILIIVGTVVLFAKLIFLKTRMCD